MKRLMRVMMFLTIAISLLLSGLPAYAASVQVTLPEFSVRLNGIPIENATRQYPLIVYKDITYFPMTYYDSRFLGLESDYTVLSGLSINRTGVAGEYNDSKTPERNPMRGMVQIAAFPISVNGKTIDNSKEDYPLLLYKGITYFPLTWRFAVDEFSWEYSFDQTRGLSINSREVDSREQLSVFVEGSINKLRSNEWLTYTFRSFNRRENRVTGILSEHPASGTKWYREITMTEAEAEAGDNSIDPTVSKNYLLLDGKLYSSENGKRWQTEDASTYTFREVPALIEVLQKLPQSAYDEASYDYETATIWLSYYDDFPAEPTEHYVGVDHHLLVIDLVERSLSTYFLSTVPVRIDENGELFIVAPPTTYYSVIDVDYQPFTIPTP